MPYSVILTRKGNGPVRVNFKIYDSPTPSHGDVIDVDSDGERVKARVTDIVSGLQVHQVTAAEI